MKINKELEAFLATENGDSDTPVGVLEFLTTISDSVQEEFDKLIRDDSYKKQFLRVLLRIFALLLNTKVDSAEKIKRIIKTAIETTKKKYGKNQVHSEKITCQDAPLTRMVGQQRVQDQEKDSLSVRDKRNNTRTKDGKHHKEWTNNKNNKCQEKI